MANVNEVKTALQQTARQGKQRLDEAAASSQDGAAAREYVSTLG
ncbi:hypothetical protein V1634_07570 [Plantactinospora veratri]|uniref:Antitoxin n=1 Tax=Plantactinospora veratri TaxID=1436122 RepID=A0ABU7S9R3_9ACTN